MELLQPRMKREVATRIVQTLLAAGTQVTTLDQVEMLFRCVLDDCLNDNAARPCGVLFGARQPGGWGGGSARMQRSRPVQLTALPCSSSLLLTVHLPEEPACPVSTTPLPVCSFITPLVQDVEGLQDLLDEEASEQLTALLACCCAVLVPACCCAPAAGPQPAGQPAPTN
jgi:hypothetical protein